MSKALGDADRAREIIMSPMPYLLGICLLADLSVESKRIIVKSCSMGKDHIFRSLCRAVARVLLAGVVHNIVTLRRLLVAIEGKCR